MRDNAKYGECEKIFPILFFGVIKSGNIEIFKDYDGNDVDKNPFLYKKYYVKFYAL